MRFDSVETKDFSYSFPIKINDSDTLWWTWDLGKPNLIMAIITLTNLNDSRVYQRSIITGLRTIKVIQ